MTSIISGDPSVYPGSFEVADDGNEPTAASVVVGVEALANRTAYLNDKKLAKVDLDGLYCLYRVGGDYLDALDIPVGLPSLTYGWAFTLSGPSAGDYKVVYSLEYQPGSGSFSGVASTTHTYRPVLLAAPGVIVPFDYVDEASYVGSGDSNPNPPGPAVRPVCVIADLHIGVSPSEIKFGFRLSSTGSIGLAGRVRSIRGRWSIYKKVVA